jgi:hypothetical protein
MRSKNVPGTVASRTGAGGVGGVLVLLEAGGVGGFGVEALGGALEEAEGTGGRGLPPGVSAPHATAAPPIANSVHVPKPRRLIPSGGRPTRVRGKRIYLSPTWETRGRAIVPAELPAVLPPR